MREQWNCQSTRYYIYKIDKISSKGIFVRMSHSTIMFDWIASWPSNYVSNDAFRTYGRHTTARDSASGQKNSIVVDVPNSSSLTRPVTASVVVPACLPSLFLHLTLVRVWEHHNNLVSRLLKVMSLYSLTLPRISRPLFSFRFINVCLWISSVTVECA